MMTSLYDSTYSFRCSVAKARLTLVFKLRLRLLIHSTKTLSFSSIQHCTQKETSYSAMLHVKSCNVYVKHNCESVFRCFASAANRN